MVEPSGEHVADPAGHIRELTDQVSALVTKADQLLNPASLERAFGAPGSPGDEAAIRDVSSASKASWPRKFSEADPETAESSA
jgi:hypothetical protein